MNMDDVFEKARVAMNAAAQKTEEVVAVSKLKLEAVKVNNEIKGMYEKLGREVYRAKDQKPHEDVVHSLCEEIDELRAKLEALDREMAELKKVVSCPSCGQKNPKENYYCMKCGAQLKETTGFDAEVVGEEAQQETAEND